ncbi:MAG TPA: glycosyltransferase [bacterium]|nr:glycosyltransferase [bacterium]
MGKPVRTLFVTHAAEFGGAELSLLEILERLDRDRIEPVLASFSDGPLVEAVKESGIDVRVINGADSFVKAKRAEMAEVLSNGSAIFKAMAAIPAALELAKFVKERRVDVVYTNSSKAHVLGGVAGRMASARVVWHFRDIFPQAILKKFFATSANMLAETVICNSRATSAQFESHKDCRVVYNGLPVEKVKAIRGMVDVRNELGLNEDARIIGMAGRLQRWKGVHVFLDAAGIIAKGSPKARFIVAGSPIYGDESYLSEMMAAARDLGIGEKVVFTGFRQDIYDIVNAMDVYVHPSETPEPFGRGIVEAMMLGKAVVVSDAGGAAEIVLDGNTGFLVTAGDARMLAKRAIELNDNPEKSRSMGEAGKKRAHELFNAIRTVEAVSRAIENC